MSNELKFHSSYTNDDVVKWVASQLEAKREPGTTLPAWMLNAFDEAMEHDKKTDASAEIAVQGEGSQGMGDTLDDMFQLELVYFKVEKTVFTVIKDWIMVEGSPFRDMFALPSGNSTPVAVEGTRMANPIILEQTSAASFKAFLCLLYGSRGKPLQTYDEWVGALDLAMRWNFDLVRHQAVAGLQLLLPSFGPVARIQLARRFSVGPWLRTGLIDLVTEVAEEMVTRTALTDGTGFALDMTTIANVFFACFELSRQSLNKGSASLSMTCEYCRRRCYRRVHYEDHEYVEDIGAYPPEGLLSPGVPEECQSCKALGDDSLKAKGDIVDGIFGPEIKGCLHTQGL